MGVRTILEARRIVLMAWGQHKSEIVRAAIEGGVRALESPEETRHSKSDASVYLFSHHTRRCILPFSDGAGSSIAKRHEPQGREPSLNVENQPLMASISCIR